MGAPGGRLRAGVTEAAWSALCCRMAPLALGTEWSSSSRQPQRALAQGRGFPPRRPAPEFPLGAIRTGEPPASFLGQWEATTEEARGRGGAASEFVLLLVLGEEEEIPCFSRGLLSQRR